MTSIDFLAAMNVIYTGAPMAADVRDAYRLALLGVSDDALHRVLIGWLRSERAMPKPVDLLLLLAQRQ